MGYNTSSALRHYHHVHENKEPNINRLESPPEYWEKQKLLSPISISITLVFLCMPASSVPCERVFSKGGEVVSKKKSSLIPKAVDKLLFLNKKKKSSPFLYIIFQVTQPYSMPSS